MQRMNRRPIWIIIVLPLNRPLTAEQERRVEAGREFGARHD